MFVKNYAFLFLRYMHDLLWVYNQAEGVRNHSDLYNTVWNCYCIKETQYRLWMMQWRCTSVLGSMDVCTGKQSREADVRGYSREHKHNWPLLYFPKSFFCWNVSAIKTVLSCLSFRSLGRKGEWELHLFGYLTGSS